MKPIEIVKLIKEKQPEVLAGIPDKKAALLIRTTLAELGKQIAAAEEGAVKVPGLGNFRVRQIKKEKPGEDAKTIKKVLFRLSKEKQGKGKSKGKKNKEQQAAQ